MTLHIQSWMLPVFFMVIGLVLLALDKWEGQYVQLPGSLTFAGLFLVIFGFGMLFGVFLP